MQMTLETSKMMAAIAMVLVLATTTLRAAGGTDVAGTYGNERITLALRAADANGVYGGTVTVDGKSYPCAGRVLDGTFDGAFQVEGKSFSVSLVPAADGSFTIISGNARHAVRRMGGPPAPAAPGGFPGPGPAAIELPKFVQPGLRLSFNSGYSTREGATLEPDPSGYIFSNGRRYRIVDHVGRGQEGIRQVTVQQADADAVIAEVRNFTINANLQGKVINHANFTVSIGNAASVEDYWVNPAILAQLPQGREADGQVTQRGKTTIDKIEFNSINIAKTDANGSASLTYDLSTGALLSMLRCNITPNLVISTPNGNASFNGTCTIERLSFIGARQIQFAWGGEAVPAWLTKGARFGLSGSYRAEIDQTPGLPQIPGTAQGFPIAISHQIRAVTKQVAISDFEVQKNVDRGGINDIPQRGIRCFGSHTYVGGLWASPKVLAALQPNQPLDHDLLTGYRTVFGGVQGNVAIVVEVGPNESTQAIYDSRSGELVATKNAIRLLPGTAQVTELQVGKQ